MEKIVALGITLTMLISMLTLTFNIQPAEADGAKYIKPDANVDLFGDKLPTRALDGPKEHSFETVAGDVKPIINPQPGQYANYSHNAYFKNGTVIWHGWWNTSYLDYLDGDLINATHTLVRPISNGTFWLAINKTNRWVPIGTHWWVNSWYSAWIETNITIGSVIKIWKTNGTVIGTAISKVGLYGLEISIDSWMVRFSEPGFPHMNYTGLFDKQSGLLIELTSSWEPHINLTLTSTNVPVGSWISVYTDKSSYSAGDTMHLGLNVTNLSNRAITVCIAVWIETPDLLTYLTLHAHAITLPIGFNYGNPSFQTFVLPSIPPGIYTWHAAFLERATHKILVEDTAQWQFT